MKKHSDPIAEAARKRWRDALPDPKQELAAFAYEMLARVSWHLAREDGADAPLYPLGKPFVKLTAGERLNVARRLQQNGGVLPPKFPYLCPADPADPAPPLGWMSVPAFEFDPEHTSAGDVAAFVKAHVEREAARLGVILLKGSTGRRNKPPAWQSLEMVDRMLSGGKLESYERQNARVLLDRHKHLWPLWYLSPNDPSVWSRPDAQAFLRIHRTGDGKH